MSPEIELLLSCARPQAECVCAPSSAIDWDLFLSFVKRHGVAPLAGSRLCKVAPQPVLVELQERAERVAKQNLFFTGTLLQILTEFEKAGIEAVPYKGPSLAQELYGDIALREFCDLDLLVRRADAPRAAAVLRGLGYSTAFELTPSQERAHLRSGCEIAFDNGRVPVEVHWELTPRAFSLSLGEGFWRRLRSLRLGEREVRALGLEDLFLVLVIHGGAHLWSRLVWVSDVARLAQRPLDWAWVESEARRIGAWRLVQLAGWVAHDLLGADLRIRVDDEVHGLAAAVRSNLAAANPESAEAARHRFLLRSRERWADRARYLWRHAFTPGVADWQVTRVPGPFYPMVRVARLVRKFGRL